MSRTAFIKPMTTGTLVIATRHIQDMYQNDDKTVMLTLVTKESVRSDKSIPQLLDEIAEAERRAAQ